MPPVFTASLAKNLDRQCAITVKEAVDGEKILPNTAYIAPGGRQMKVTDDIFKMPKSFGLPMTLRKMGAPLQPTIFFRSVAELFGGCATASS